MRNDTAVAGGDQVQLDATRRRGGVEEPATVLRTLRRDQLEKLATDHVRRALTEHGLDGRADRDILASASVARTTTPARSRSVTSSSAVTWSASVCAESPGLCLATSDSTVRGGLAAHGRARGRRVSDERPSLHSGHEPGARRCRTASSCPSSRASRVSAPSTPSRSRPARVSWRSGRSRRKLEALRPRARRPDDGSDDARGRGHARQGCGALREGDSTRPGRRERLVGRGGLCLPEPRRNSPVQRLTGLDASGRVRRDCVPLRPVAPRGEARGRPGGG